MIEETWLPRAISIGISYDDFWHMNPHIIQIHIKAHKQWLQERNELAYIQGVYMRDAIESSICNGFRAKGSKPYEYPKEPYEFWGERELTEQEKDMQINQIFANLQLMKSNFEKNRATTDCQ